MYVKDYRSHARNHVNHDNILVQRLMTRVKSAQDEETITKSLWERESDGMCTRFK